MLLSSVLVSEQIHRISCTGYELRLVILVVHVLRLTTMSVQRWDVMQTQSDAVPEWARIAPQED